MDLNIGAALWMAAKAEGHVTVAPASSASSQQPHAHQAAKLAGSEPASSATAPHDKKVSKHRTCSSDVQPQITRHRAADAAQSQESRQDQSDSVQDAHNAQEGVVHAASSSPASSSNYPTRHAVASASNTASPGGAQQIGNEQNGDCTSSRGAVCGGAEPARQTGVKRLGWYKSAARVVLLGHGADEQHAGYGRHRTSFRNEVSPISLNFTFSIDLRSFLARFWLCHGSTRGPQKVIFVIEWGLGDSYSVVSAS